MLDAKRLLDQFLGGQEGKASGLGSALGGMGGVGGGALAGGLAALLLGTKTGRKLGSSALQLGGMAAVGALAYKAYRDWQAVKSGATVGARQNIPSQTMLPPPSGSQFNPTSEDGQQKLARMLLRAMIAATKADGHIDEQERARLVGEIEKLNLTAEEKAFVMDELQAKLDIDAVAGAATTQEEAAEIYTASLLAIDVDNAAERGYLTMLAARLNLDDSLIAHLQQSVTGATAKS
jgi:uncharacterized membrane protein YebE (DUF533 family)